MSRSLVTGVWVRIVGHETGRKGRSQIMEGQIREDMFGNSPVNYNSLVKYLKDSGEIFFSPFIVLFKKNILRGRHSGYWNRIESPVSEAAVGGF